MHNKTTLGFSLLGIQERNGTAINGAPGIEALLYRVVVIVVVFFLYCGAAVAGREEKITDSIIATVAVFFI